MLQDSHEAIKLITPPIVAAGTRHANRKGINAYNSLSRPETKEDEADSYTVTLTTSPADRRTSVFNESIDESKTQPLMARK